MKPLNPRLENWLKRKKLTPASLANKYAMVEFSNFITRNALKYKHQMQHGIVDYDDFTKYLKTAEL